MFHDFKLYIQKTFDKAAESYDEAPPFLFDYFGKELIRYAELGPAPHILDISCGKGAVSLNIALQYPQADITAIDLSPAMIKALQLKVKTLGLNNIRAIVMDAEALDFPEHQFDAVFCGFGLFFLPEIEKTLKSIYRSLIPGGLLAYSSFRAMQEYSITKAVTKIYFPDENMDHYSANHYNFRILDDMENLLEDAGLIKWKIINERKEFCYASLEQWWDKQWSHGRAGKLMQLQKEGRLEQFRNDCFKVITPHLINDQFRVYEDVFYIYGIKPA